MKKLLHPYEIDEHYNNSEISLFKALTRKYLENTIFYVNLLEKESNY